jgi:hypothetical protein
MHKKLKNGFKIPKNISVNQVLTLNLQYILVNVLIVTNYDQKVKKALSY